MSKAHQFLHQWTTTQNYKALVPNNSNNASSDWIAPPMEFLKSNVDATLFTINNSFSAGICIHDNLDHFIAAKKILTNGLFRPPEAKALALYHAISWTIDLGLQNIIFETDCKSIVDHISNPKLGSSYLNVIIRKCRTNLSLSPKSRVSFLRRQANLVVHNLAREARSYASIHVFDHVLSLTMFLLVFRI